jgi:hypothetical protein
MQTHINKPGNRGPVGCNHPNTKEKMKMNKKIMLPALAAFMILVMVATAFPAATALVVKAKADPLNMPLKVVTIAEDDQDRNQGIMIFCVIHDITFNHDKTKGDANDPRAYDPNTCKDNTWVKKWTDYKILVLQPNGELFYWAINLGTSGPSGFSMKCEVIEKDTVEPKVPQDTWEMIKKVVTDRSSDFKCKPRWKSTGGFFYSVGALDLYFTGKRQASEDIAPYIVSVEVLFTDPLTKLPYYGNDIQDLCVLAWPFNDPTEWQKRPYNLQKPEHKELTMVPDAMDGFVSCEDATNFQRSLLGAYIPTAPGN